MVKFKFEPALGELFWLPVKYYAMELDVVSSKKAVMTSNNGATAVFTGSGLDDSKGHPSAGTVSAVRFYDEDHDLVLTISGGHFKFKDMRLDMLANIEKFEAGNDLFLGTSKADLIGYTLNKGNDTINGFGGNDEIYGSPGANTIDGGAGNRDVIYYGLDKGVTGIFANLKTGKIDNPWHKVDTVKGVEDIRGTRFDDGFVGSKRNEFFAGSHGDDYMEGGGGADQMFFTEDDGHDTFVDFGNGDDSVALGATEFMHTFKQVMARIHNDGDDAVLLLDSGDEITFLNMSKRDFAKDDFVFIF